MRTITCFLLLLICPASLAEVEKVSVETWIAELESDDAGRSILAAQMLGDMKAKAAPAIPALIKALSDPRENPAPNYAPVGLPGVARSAADAIAQIGEPAVPALVVALDSTTKKRTRSLIIDSLRKIGKPAAKAIPQLKKIVEDRSDELRFYALDALGVIHPPDADLVAFASEQLNDKSPETSALAVHILGRAGKVAAPAVDQLIKLLADPDNRAEAITPDMIGQRPVRADAADALGQIGQPAAAAIPSLTKMMADDKEAVPRAAAASALIRIDEKNTASVHRTLNKMLTDKSGHTGDKIEAAHALAALGPKAKDSLPALAKLLRHKNDDVRFAEINAITEIAGKDAIPLLQPALKDKDEFNRERAQEAIDKLKAPPQPQP